MNRSPSHQLDGNAPATDVKIATRSKRPVGGAGLHPVKRRFSAGRGLEDRRSLPGAGFTGVISRNAASG